MADEAGKKNPSPPDGPRQQEQMGHQDRNAQIQLPTSPQSSHHQRHPQQYYSQQQYQNTQHPQHTQHQFGPGGTQQPYRPQGPAGNQRDQYGMNTMMQGYPQQDYRQQSSYGSGNRGGSRGFHPGGPSSHGQPIHQDTQFTSQQGGGQAPMQSFYMPQQTQMMPQTYYGGSMKQAGSPTMSPRHGGYGYYSNQAPVPNYYYTQSSQYTHQHQPPHNQGPPGSIRPGLPGSYSSPPYAARRPSQSAAAAGGAWQEGAESSQMPNQRSQGQGQPQPAAIVRGPPRKPKQSGHAIWVGNLPPQTDLMSLVHHVCAQTTGLESLFLISKSNCAFANYPDEERCLEAQQKLNDSYYMSVRLVSRLRKNAVEGAQGVTAPTGPAALSQPLQSPRVNAKSVDATGRSEKVADSTLGDAERPRKPSVQTSVIVDGSDKSGTKGKAFEGGEWTSSSTPVSSGSDVSSNSEKYFILKSLTVEDLELSVRTGIWATQAHNEVTLDEAFKSCDSVYLIFSANKSGEYFGYARMTSEINQDPAAAIEFAPTSQSFNDADLPKAIPTEATETTPRGRIIDDSARGTIFWEVQSNEADSPEVKFAEHEAPGDKDDSGLPEHDNADGDVVDGVDGDDGADGADGRGESQTWGKPFKLEWLSTTRLPFYRTRGLRNPLNANREIKIARDGTEIEASIGRKLLNLFHQEAVISPVAGGGGSGGGRGAMPASASYSSLPGTRVS